MWGHPPPVDDDVMASTAPERDPPLPAKEPQAWFAQDEAAVVAALDTDAAQGII